VASTVGHSICGIACFVVARRLNPDIGRCPTAKGILFFILLANLPDFDLLAGYLFASNPLQYHWGFTHTLWFSLLAGISIGRTLKASGYLFDFGSGLVALVIGSHIAIDLVTGSRWGFHPSYGLKLLAPLWDIKVSSPISVFLGVKHEPGYLFGRHNLMAVVIDVLVFVPIVIALAATSGNKWRRWKRVAQSGQ
jgi:membrane-bound metal-dependent hydrolase YbcI (DUF457 family)